jgi:hypothetical protein
MTLYQYSIGQMAKRSHDLHYVIGDVTENHHFGQHWVGRVANIPLICREVPRRSATACFVGKDIEAGEQNHHSVSDKISNHSIRKDGRI